MYRITILVLLSLIGFSFGLEVHYKSCGNSTTATVKSVDVDPCDDPHLCALNKGTKPKITIDFTPTTQISAVKVGVIGVLPGGIEVEFPLPNGDGCKESGLTCPIEIGKESRYFTSVPVMEEYPSWQVIVKFQLTDQSNNTIVCVQIQTHIAEANSTQNKSISNETKNVNSTSGGGQENAAATAASSTAAATTKQMSVATTLKQSGNRLYSTPYWLLIAGLPFILAFTNIFQISH